MACKNCKLNPVWKFTNQIELCENCFTDYFERKTFRTIRKFNMLPENKIIRLKRSSSLNYKVLTFVLKKKFELKISDSKINFSSENLSDSAEKIFTNILIGKFNGPMPKDDVSRPLYFLSDREIELYAHINRIKGKKRNRNKRVQKLFNKFMKDNSDLEHNVVNALSQLKE
ncbi:MAG: hypothetical protein ACOYT4_02045 [Nanoarchaeota archaeon]